MRFSYEWLCELARIDGESPQKVAETLTMAGFNVEELKVIDYSKILVGRILSQEPHPKSNKPLWIHQVDLGSETRQIIAGAPNAVPGSLVPVALPGTTVPLGATVRDGKIAGYEARGMLCSESELLLSEDSEGIMLLEEGAPGQHFEELIPSDAILEIEVTPNRPDCLGHLGLARELAAALGRSLGRDFMPPFTGGVEPPGRDLVKVSIESPELCPRYIGAVISSVTVGSSPSWMQRRLRRAGVRPINNVVDVTNYVLLEYGQPLHAFDLTKISGRQIRVRRARDGEELLCLDGESRRLTSQMLVIADAERAIAIAGLIGGEESAVSESTTDLLLEAACFDGVSVRSTSRALRLRTEASTRFEKGLSPELALAGARRAAMLLAEVAGGSVHIEWADEYPHAQEPVRITFQPGQVESLLGTHISGEEMGATLERLEFQVRPHEDSWDALPPVFRLDVTTPADLAEEVGRIYGYERIPATLPGRRRANWRVVAPSQDRVLDSARHSLGGAGYTETVGAALVPHRRLEQLGLAERAMTVINPISEELDALRTSLIVTMLQAAALNRRLQDQVSLFEIGRTYLRRLDEPEAQPQEPSRLGLLRTSGPEAEAGRAAFLHLKGAFERAVRTLAPHIVTYEPDSGPLYHPGRCALVLVNGSPAGHLGELHPEVRREFDLPGRAVALEVDVAPLLTGPERRYRPLPRFPAVERDLAVVVPEQVLSAHLRDTIRQAGGELLAEAQAFDEYHGAQVGVGKKSVAFSLTFRSPERTLTDQEVDQVLEKIRVALSEQYGALLRS
jgi:phenylalanyl-tRNA synthetase beta chain